MNDKRVTPFAVAGFVLMIVVMGIGSYQLVDYWPARILAFLVTTVPIAFWSIRKNFS